MLQSYSTTIEYHDISVYLTYSGAVNKKGIHYVSVNPCRRTHSLYSFFWSGAKCDQMNIVNEYVCKD